jgi:hypothetical protein
LTPDGDPPSYRSCFTADYEGARKELESIVGEGILIDGTLIDQEVSFALVHYTRMLRRNIVANAETVGLARRLYIEHRVAFDLVYTHRFSQQKRLRKTQVGLIEETPGLTFRSRDR